MLVRLLSACEYNELGWGCIEQLIEDPTWEQIEGVFGDWINSVFLSFGSS